MFLFDLNSISAEASLRFAIEPLSYKTLCRVWIIKQVSAVHSIFSLVHLPFLMFQRLPRQKIFIGEQFLEFTPRVLELFPRDQTPDTEAVLTGAFTVLFFLSYQLRVDEIVADSLLWYQAAGV